MLGRHLLWIPVVLVTASAFGQEVPNQPKATAKMVNAAGVQIGTATLNPTIRGTAVQINMTLSKLPPGTHALHVHAVGKCDPPAFTSAGPHFNPTNKQHGTENPNGPHAGDLPNFDADAQGAATVSLTVPGLSFGDGPDSLFHEGGTALVIHGAADDYKTDPAGNAGPRIACGVIEKQHL